MKIATRYPDTTGFSRRCHRAPAPDAAILRYAAGDYNCSPGLTASTCFPSSRLPAPERDFTAASLADRAAAAHAVAREVVPLRQGDGVIFPHHRPVEGTRGHRVTMRHGASRLRAGHHPRWELSRREMRRALAPSGAIYLPNRMAERARDRRRRDAIARICRGRSAYPASDQRRCRRGAVASHDHARRLPDGGDDQLRCCRLGH